jgi:hypothetical protein
MRRREKRSFPCLVSKQFPHNAKWSVTIPLLTLGNNEAFRRRIKNKSNSTRRFKQNKLFRSKRGRPFRTNTYFIPFCQFF